MRNKDKETPSPPAPAAPKAKLLPPPRRVPVPTPRAPSPEPVEEEEEEEAKGEWAEALYDYKTTVRFPYKSCCKLRFLMLYVTRRIQMIFHCARNSMFWSRNERLMTGMFVRFEAAVISTKYFLRWTGEADGKSGLFPASYVKLL